MANSTVKPTKTKRRSAGNVLQIAPETPFDLPPTAQNLPETPPVPAEPEETLDFLPIEQRPLVRASVEPFPPYPRPNTKGGVVDPEAAIKYWRSLPAEFIERSCFYVIREWPILDRLRELTFEELELIRLKKKREPYKNIDKRYTPYEEKDIRMAFLRRYGSGDYKCYFNDTGVAGAKDINLKSRNLFMCRMSFHDPDFPPILDPSRPDKGLGVLDLVAPANQSYIADLRMKGALPAAKDEEQMANSDVVNKLTDQVGQLANEVAQGKSERLLADIKQEIRTALPEKGESTVMQTMLQLMLAQMQAPKQNGTDPIVQLFQAQMQSVQAELQAERAERRKYEAEIRERANAPQPDPFAHFERMITTIEKAKSFFSGAGTVAAAAEAAPIVRSRLTPTMEFIREIAPEILNPLKPLIGAFAQKMMTPAGPGMNGMNGHAPNGAPTNGAIPQQQRQPQTLIDFIEATLLDPMVSYIDDEAPGSNFAEFVFNGWPPKLTQIQQLTHPQLPGQQGASVIIELLKHTSLWPSQLAHREQQVRQFVDDFCKWRPASSEEPGQAQASAPGEDGVIELDLGEENEGDTISQEDKG